METDSIEVLSDFFEYAKTGALFTSTDPQFYQNLRNQSLPWAAAGPIDIYPDLITKFFAKNLNNCLEFFSNGGNHRFS